MQSLLPGQLFHVGVVADDIDAAMADMSRALGLTWKGGQPERRETCLYGEERSIEMRAAHSVQGPPHVEVIQSIPGTPWETPAAAGAHHLCFWTDNSTEVCAALERAGYRRVTGRPGATSGSFLSTGGLDVEILSRDQCERLSAWIRGERASRY